MNSLILPFRVMVCDDETVLSFISRSNPIIQAQHNVTQAYAKPDPGPNQGTPTPRKAVSVPANQPTG